MISKNLKEEIISLSWGCPDLKQFPLEDFKKNHL